MAPVVFYLFDLLWDCGRDLTGKSVLQRRERLQEIIHSSSRNSSGGYLEKRGVELFQLAKEKCFESPISKWQPSRGKKLLS
jgi:ATP-dependent DNA ligase